MKIESEHVKRKPKIKYSWTLIRRFEYHNSTTVKGGVAVASATEGPWWQIENTLIALLFTMQPSRSKNHFTHWRPAQTGKNAPELITLSARAPRSGVPAPFMVRVARFVTCSLKPGCAKTKTQRNELQRTPNPYRMLGKVLQSETSQKPKRAYTTQNNIADETTLLQAT